MLTSKGTVTQDSEVTVRLPVGVWLSGAVAFMVTVGTVTLAWSNISHEQTSTSIRLNNYETNQAEIGKILNDTVKALAELRGEVHANKRGS